jgi:hypothetical protein
MTRQAALVVTAVAALLFAAGACAAAADGGYSVQKNGKWYWSTDVANSIYPQAQPPEPGISEAREHGGRCRCKWPLP